MSSKETRTELLQQLKLDNQPQPKSGVSVFSTILFAIIAAAAGAGVTYYWFSSQLPLSQTAQPPKSLTTERTEPAIVMLQEVDESAKEPPANENPELSNVILNASGYITARLVATVSSEVTGLIKSVDVEEGMQVETGQVLARLDDAIARTNLQLAKDSLRAQQARLRGVRAEIVEAEKVLHRVSNLEGGQYSSEAELTSATARLESAKAAYATTLAEIDVAKQRIDIQQEILGNHEIRAPFAGVVIDKAAQPGEIISPGASGGFTRTGICTVVDMESLEIEVDVNEAFIGRVTPGQAVMANLDAYPDWDIPASVIAIIPTADRAKATVRVRIKIEQRDARILPNMGVKVAFLRASESTS